MAIVSKTLADCISEKQFMGQVLQLAGLLGWRHYHTFDSRRSSAGFVDAILVKPPRLLAIEFKTERGKESPAQADWLGDLRQCPGVECYVWKPSDWETVVRILEGMATPWQSQKPVDRD